MQIDDRKMSYELFSMIGQCQEGKEQKALLSMNDSTIFARLTGMQGCSKMPELSNIDKGINSSMKGVNQSQKLSLFRRSTD